MKNARDCFMKKVWKKGETGNVATSSTFKMFLKYLSDKEAIASLFLTKFGFLQWTVNM